MLTALAVTAAITAGCGGTNRAAGSATEIEGGDALAQVDCDGPRRATAQEWVTPIAEDPTPSLPVTVTDFTGEQVTVTDTSRILALDNYGTLATTVYALGLGDRLVGRDVSTGVPALADLPVVTHNGHELAAEAILDLDPTVILTDYSIGPLEVQLQLKESGIPVVVLDSQRSRAVIAEQITAVAETLGVPDVGEELAAAVTAQVAEAEADVAEMSVSEMSVAEMSVAERSVAEESVAEESGTATNGEPMSAERSGLRTVFLYLRGRSGVYQWFGKGSGADDLMDALRLHDVASKVGLEGARPLNAEGLVKAEPDLYLMMSDGLESVGGVDGLLEIPGVADTAAGATGCVVDMADAQILSFGPQFPATLRALGDAIYGPDGVIDRPDTPS